MSYEAVLNQINNKKAGKLTIKINQTEHIIKTAPKEYLTLGDMHFKSMKTGVLLIFLDQENKLRKIYAPADALIEFETSGAWRRFPQKQKAGFLPFLIYSSMFR